MQEHDKLIPLHDELLKRNAEDIKEIKDELYGIPQRIDSLEKSVTELCRNISENNKNIMELLRGLEGKFQTKEMSMMNEIATNKELKALRDDINDLKKEKDALKNKLIWTFGAFIVQLVVWIFLNHSKFGY